MTQNVVSTTPTPDGQWVTTTYDDGSSSFGPAPGSTIATQQANLAALQAKAQQALTNNATFQAIASPTNAQIATQVQALTKQCNGIIRLLLNVLDSTSGT